VGQVELDLGVLLSQALALLLLVGLAALLVGGEERQGIGGVGLGRGRLVVGVDRGAGRPAATTTGGGDGVALLLPLPVLDVRQDRPLGIDPPECLEFGRPGTLGLLGVEVVLGLVAGLLGLVFGQPLADLGDVLL
jgi:hypothetical protein